MKLDLGVKTVSSNSILSQVDEETIYKFYYDKFALNKRVFSPFREEKNPSFYFFRSQSNDSILWRDYGDGGQVVALDVFEFVKRLYNCSYMQALQKINEDLILQLDSLPIVKIKKEPVEKVNKKISYKRRQFTIEDYNYWEKQYKIPLSQLSDYKVYPVTNVIIHYDDHDSNPIISNYFNPIYAFELNDGVKIYMPLSDRTKWLFSGTMNDIFGLDKLPEKGLSLIITKSLKDIIVLNNLGFDAIAPQSETLFISDELYNELKTRFQHIYLLYDSDESGIKAAEKIKESHKDLKIITLPRIGTAKDISDLIRMHEPNNVVALKELLSKLMKKTN